MTVPHGDAYLPDLAYSQNNYSPLGKYGMLRKTYLQVHHKALFSKMLLRDELWPHLLEIDEKAHAMVETMIAQMAKARRCDGIAEIDRPAALGGTDEQFQEHSGGDRSAGDRVRINIDTW